MRDDMRPTFKQVRDYFINKEAKPPITNEYMKTGYGQKKEAIKEAILDILISLRFVLHKENTFQKMNSIIKIMKFLKTV